MSASQSGYSSCRETGGAAVMRQHRLHHDSMQARTLYHTEEPWTLLDIRNTYCRSRKPEDSMPIAVIGNRKIQCCDRARERFGVDREWVSQQRVDRFAFASSEQAAEGRRVRTGGCGSGLLIIMMGL